MPSARLIGVGVFVIGGFLLFAAGLFLIGERRLLFRDSFEVFAEFKTLSGLQGGAKVRVAGMDAGEVLEIHVPKGPSAPFRVKVSVREDLHTLVRTDSTATIQNDGLVGNKFVQIQAGTEASPQVADQGTIGSREPFDVADLFAMMNDTLVTLNKMLVDVKANVDAALVAVSTTATDAQALIADMGGEIGSIMTTARRATVDVSEIIGNVRQGRGTVGKLMTDDSLYATVRSIAADTEKAMAAVREASLDARNAIAELRGDKGPVRGLTGDAQQTLKAARDAMTNLAEATEALKRNFLFRGFFNRRGYFDLEDVSVQQYRQGVLETKDRRALRIWLGADVLFERGADGRERLSAAGTARLDSAMSQFLRYPPRSPFVVEGYAEGATGDERYLISRERSRLVSDYLVAKFQLDVNYIATMPMGAEAKGSPRGDRWDGIALALFVHTDAL